MRYAAIGVVLVLPTFASIAAAGGDEAKVYYGSLKGAKKPAEVVASTIFKEISEYKKIKEKGLTSDDSEYWILLNKANEKFYKAVTKAAGDAKCDVVVEKGSAKLEGKPTDLTQKVIDALEK